MSKSKVEFIKYLHKQIELQKMRRNPEASKLEGRLFDLLDSEFDHSERLQSIEDNVERIAASLKVSSKSAEDAAIEFYGVLTDDFEELKGILIESYCKWDSAANRGEVPDLKLACKHIIIQVEAVFKFFEPLVIQFIESTPENQEQYNFVKFKNESGDLEYRLDKNGNKITRIENDGQNKYMRPRSMTWALRALLEYLGLKIYIPNDILNDIFNVRNFDGHAITGKSAERFKNSLAKIESNPSKYFDGCFKMLQSLLPAMVTIKEKVSKLE